MEIIEMRHDHWTQVKTIYENGIATGNATFQTSAPEWEEWDSAHVKTCRLVVIENEKVLGWAALTTKLTAVAFELNRITCQPHSVAMHRMGIFNSRTEASELRFWHDYLIIIHIKGRANYGQK